MQAVPGLGKRSRTARGGGVYRPLLCWSGPVTRGTERQKLKGRAEMRVAVVGGTGLVGGHTTEALRHAGHDAVVVARSTGTDVTTGAGLDAALAGVEAVIDVTNTFAQDADEAREFFAAATGHLLATEQRAGVGHHVVLSIVGVDRVGGNAHFAGKRRQEELTLAGPVPATIMRATQFHEFAAMVVGWTQQGDAATVPRTLAARGQSIRLIPSWRDGPFSVAPRSHSLPQSCSVRS